MVYNDRITSSAEHSCDRRHTITGCDDASCYTECETKSNLRGWTLTRDVIDHDLCRASAAGLEQQKLMKSFPVLSFKFFVLP